MNEIASVEIKFKSDLTSSLFFRIAKHVRPIKRHIYNSIMAMRSCGDRTVRSYQNLECYLNLILVNNFVRFACV